MIKSSFFRFCTVCFLALVIPTLAFSETVGVFFDSNVAQIKFAAGDVKAALESKNFEVELLPLSSLNASYKNKKVVVALASDKAVTNEKFHFPQFEYFKYVGKDPWFDKHIDPKAQYMNPIIAGFYPDPSICRKGDTYFMVNSTFGYFPAVPIFTSKDLVNWTQIGHVLDRPSQFSFIGKEMHKGIYAPAIEYNPYNDTFYMITTDVGGGGNFFVKSKDPAKGWSERIRLPEVKHIDPSFFFDDDGKAYIVHNSAPETNRNYPGEHSIRIHEFDVANDCTIGKTKEIIRSGVNPAEKPIWIEGPHLYKMFGYYYVMAAEGGTGDQHSEVIFRSKSPWGPFEAAPYNPILTQRDLPKDRANRITSSGHADIIQTPEGDWWAVFLAVRPYEGEYVFNTGRETFLLPVEWENGFPIINRKGVSIPTIVNKKNLQPSEHFNNGNYLDNQLFDGQKLDFSWIFIRTPQQAFHAVENGKLTLKPLPICIESKQSPAAVVRRQQHTSFSVETQVEFTPKTENDFAGLTLFQNENHLFLVGKTIVNGKTVLAVNRKEKENETLVSVVLNGKAAAKPVKLRVDGKAGKCDFSYSFDGKKWISLAQNADATNLSSEKGGGFQGVTIGMYATSDHLNKIVFEKVGKK